MRLSFYFGIVLITLIIGCKKTDQSGYNCNNGVCSATFDNPQYLTLADCKSDCGSSTNSSGYNCSNGTCIKVTKNAQFENLTLCQNNCQNNSPGSVEISAVWTTNYVNCNPAFTVVIGFGYTSTDVANEAYFSWF